MKRKERSVLTVMGQQPEKVAGGFFCFGIRLTSLAGCPSSVTGDFYCYKNKLTSLTAGPASVGGNFGCSTNNLTSLVGAPTSVGGNFFCNNNQLTSLVDCPTSVGGDFNCSVNKLMSLHDVHKHLKKLNGQLYCWSNPIKSHVLGLFLVDGIRKVACDKLWALAVNKHITYGKKGMLACQREMIDAGLEEYAQL